MEGLFREVFDSYISRFIDEICEMKDINRENLLDVWNNVSCVEKNAEPDNAAKKKSVKKRSAKATVVHKAKVDNEKHRCSTILKSGAKKGKACGNIIKDEGEFCGRHRAAVVLVKTCSFILKSGKVCKKAPLKGGKICSVHAKKQKEEKKEEKIIEVVEEVEEVAEAIEIIEEVVEEIKVVEVEEAIVEVIVEMAQLEEVEEVEVMQVVAREIDELFQEIEIEEEEEDEDDIQSENDEIDDLLDEIKKYN